LIVKRQSLAQVGDANTYDWILSRFVVGAPAEDLFANDAFS
jgi:hypothetical protein